MTAAQQDRDFSRRVETIYSSSPIVQGWRAERPECPHCGSDDISRRHHHPDALAPECHWYECHNCGHQTDPS